MMKGSKHNKMKTKSLRINHLVFGFGIFLGLISVIGVVVLFVINLKNESFMQASLYSLLGIITTIFVALCITYYFTEVSNDKRKQKDILLTHLQYIRNQLEGSELTDINDEESLTVMRIKKRALDNSLHILAEHKGKYNISNRVDRILEYFNDYESIIGEHISDIAGLQLVKPDLTRVINNISYRILELTFSVF